MIRAIHYTRICSIYIPHSGHTTLYTTYHAKVMETLAADVPRAQTDGGKPEEVGVRSVVPLMEEIVGAADAETAEAADGQTGPCAEKEEREIDGAADVETVMEMPATSISSFWAERLGSGGTVVDVTGFQLPGLALDDVVAGGVTTDAHTEAGDVELDWKLIIVSDVDIKSDRHAMCHAFMCCKGYFGIR